MSLSAVHAPRSLGGSSTLRHVYHAWLDVTAPMRNGMRAPFRVSGRHRNEIRFLQTREWVGAHVRMHGVDNIVSFDRHARIRGCHIDIWGDRNEVVIGASHLRGIVITCRGSGNSVVISDRCVIRELDIVCEDDANRISVGSSTRICGRTEMAAIEGTSIDLGESCLLADDVRIRTGDSHSILDGSGVRTNPSRDVSIGDRAWLGMRTTILKGSVLGEATVVGAGAVVSGAVAPAGHCVLAGNPAHVVRGGTDWRYERLPVGVSGGTTG